ncbi:GTPase Era [Candidatus Nesciobacter abundans]|nr:GTPase Era [Candidatus Nesciobacter abundans]
MNQKCSLVAIVGPPNAGKSSLLNNWLNKKISIVSSKPHTTRNNVFGSVTKEDTQVVFVDTPGFAKKHGVWGKHLQKSMYESLKDVDTILLVIDSLSPFKLGTEILFDVAKKTDANLLVTVHKTDRPKKSKLYEIGRWLKESKSYEDPIFLTSTNTKTGTEKLLDKIVSLAKEGPWLFDKDQDTNLTKEWIGAEYVREKVFQSIHQEVPFNIAVQPTEWDFNSEKWVLRVRLLVRTLSHKKIIIGKKGFKLQQIGSAARAELMSLWGPGQLFVEVVKDNQFEETIKELYYSS